MFKFSQTITYFEAWQAILGGIVSLIYLIANVVNFDEDIKRYTNPDSPRSEFDECSP